jgi:hypothetical protein
LFQIRFDTKKLLLLAWEDPENEDAIPDYVDDDIDSYTELGERTYDSVFVLSDLIEKLK